MTNSDDLFDSSQYCYSTQAEVATNYLQSRMNSHRLYL